MDAATLLGLQNSKKAIISSNIGHRFGFARRKIRCKGKFARRAAEYTGIEVKKLRFEEFSETEKYDGIWACASLLHVKRKDLVGVVRKLLAGLKTGGVMYASFKYGNSERIKEDRFFCDMNEDTVKKLFEVTGMSVTEMFVTGDVREDRNQEKWINVIIKNCSKEY